LGVGVLVGGFGVAVFVGFSVGVFVAVFGTAVFVGFGVPVLVACIGVGVFVGFSVAVFVTGFGVAVFDGFGIEVVAANGCNALAAAPVLPETYAPMSQAPNAFSSTNLKGTLLLAGLSSILYGLPRLTPALTAGDVFCTL
jgi:hypothetical protein